MASRLSLNPWVSVWLRPKETVHQIVFHDPGYMRFRLFFSAGVSQGLALWVFLFARGGVADAMGLFFRSVLLGFLAVFSILYAFSFILTKAGRAVGGNATREGMTLALRVSLIPSVEGFCFLMLPYFALMVLGGYSGSPFESVFFACLLGYLASLLWSAAVAVYGVSEVQQFTLSKAAANVLASCAILVNALLAVLLFGAVLFLVVVAYAILAGGRDFMA